MNWLDSLMDLDTVQGFEKELQQRAEEALTAAAIRFGVAVVNDTLQSMCLGIAFKDNQITGLTTESIFELAVNLHEFKLTLRHVYQAKVETLDKCINDFVKLWDELHDG